MSNHQAQQILEEILTLPELEEDALDYMGCQGALAAFVIMPKNVDTNVIADHILDEAAQNLSQDKLNTFVKAINVQMSDFKIQLEGEESIELSWMNEDEDEDALISWASGFVEVVFAYEDQWLSNKFEEDAMQLLMPIIALSGLLEEETADITNNEQLFNQWIDEVPDLLVDLFLLNRVIDDKKGNDKGKSFKPGNSNQKKRGSRGKKPASKR